MEYISFLKKLLKKKNRYLFFNLNILIIIALSRILQSCKLKPPKTNDSNLENKNNLKLCQIDSIIIEEQPHSDNGSADKSNTIIRERLNKKSFDIESLKQNLDNTTPKTNDLSLEDKNKPDLREVNTTKLLANESADKSNTIIRERLNKKSFDIEDLKQKLNDNFASNKIKLNNIKQQNLDYTKKNFASLFKKFNYSNENLLNKLDGNFFPRSIWKNLYNSFVKILKGDKNNLDQKLLTSLENFIETEFKLSVVDAWLNFINFILNYPAEPRFQKNVDILNKYEFDIANPTFKKNISLEKAKDNYKKFTDFVYNLYKIQTDETRWWDLSELVSLTEALLGNYSNNINKLFVGIIYSDHEESELKKFIKNTTEQKNSIGIFNINKNHFITAVAIRHPDGSVTILCKDSLSNGGDNHTLAKAVISLDENIEIKFNKHTESRQKNCIDCGTFSLTNAAILLEDLSNRTKYNINQYIESFSEISYFCTQDYVKELKEYYFSGYAESLGDCKEWGHYLQPQS